MLKSLDSDISTRLFDSVANPIISLHLQARHSFDESSSDLISGIHNSWRLSNWSKRIHGASLFKIDEENGSIEIPADGLYFVYAQVCLFTISAVVLAVLTQRRARARGSSSREGHSRRQAEGSFRVRDYSLRRLGTSQSSA